MKRNLIVLFVSLVLFSCDFIEEEEEVTFGEWPASISGCDINIYIENANGASVEGVIRYSFDVPSEQVRGTNPETGQTFTADSYTYTRSGSTANIRLSYSNGQAFENYTLSLRSESGGSYSMNSATPTASGSSNGSFDFTCF